ncbi:glycoside hydrolase family 104 protein [Halomonas sp. ATCH28]|uniref:Glycoside hydrolase family 104 protein n=1 Tax=Halomonas gemina TaxID=2945105 RepID=A0ABT0T2Q5_9GAMM|nr:glycoside hydrolase family 104 protein [Halomonas gemina]MCL7941206.1 glycoside hydrolase family 104 protein [Halomonas gemina]
MPRITPDQAGGRNVIAFLDTLAFAEIGPAMLAASDDGYDVLVGSLPSDLHLFADYADHPLPTPNHAIEYAPGVYSTAAGRYQILSRYWDHYRRQLVLPNFGPESQDRYAIQQIREQRALSMVQAGHFLEAVERCKNIWASLPGAGYGQHEHDIATLARVYAEAGGQFSGTARNWYDEVDARHA